MNGNNQNGSTKKPETLTNGSGLQNGDLSKQRADGPPRRSTKKSGRTRAERSSKEFFDALLSNRKVGQFCNLFTRLVYLSCLLFHLFVMPLVHLNDCLLSILT